MNEHNREMTDDQLRRLLRSAVPPVEPMLAGSDAWPSIAARLDAHPGWTLADMVLAAGIILALTLMPDLLFVLALHF